MKGSHTIGKKSKDCLPPSFHNAVPTGLHAALKGDVKLPTTPLHPHNVVCIVLEGWFPTVGLHGDSSSPSWLPTQGMRLTQKRCSEPLSEPLESAVAAWKFWLPELIFF